MREGLVVPGPLLAVRPEGQLAVCSQCRREVVRRVGGWRHVDDYTPRCPVGLADAVARLARFVLGWG